MKKLITFLLALVISLTSISAVYAESDSKSSEKKSEARQMLELQSRGQFKKDEKVNLVIELKTEQFSEFGRSLEAKELRNKKNLPKQVNFAKSANKKALKNIKDKGIKFNLLYTVDVIMVGFTGESTYGDALKISDLPFIKSVSIAVEYKAPEISNKQIEDDIRMMSSRKMVNTDRLSLDLDGRSGIVAVLDSGFDVNNESFYLTQAGKNAARLKTSFDVTSKNLGRGQWINDKIPFAYNYANKNNIIADQGSSHGQHVAGTAVGNETDITLGNERLKFKGIAPEAQLLAMRVFPSGRGTGPHIYIPAMDDAVKLGADSINMSLGSPAGDRQIVESTGIYDAIERAGDIGCVVAMAAGNEAQFGRSVQSPKSYNPDFGVVGSPAVSLNGLAVANLENIKSYSSYGTIIQYDSNAKVIEKYAAIPVYGTDIYSPGKASKIIDLGYITNTDNVGDITGKGVMVDVGPLKDYEIQNEKLIRDLAAKKPNIILVYSSQTDIKYIFNMFDPILNIPVAGISNNIAKIVKTNVNSLFSFTTNPSYSISANNGNISDSSSWGVSADGDIKPDILAPGGNIYSTVYNNQYESQSGTSMASPHVAGGIAIIRARVNRDFPNLSDREKYVMVKNLLMSTAIPHKNIETNALSSPRHQGSGLMDLLGASRSEVILFDGNTHDTKVNLGDVSSSFDVTFKIKNYGSTSKSYKITGFLTTDLVQDDYMTLRPLDLGTVDGGTVTVAAKSEKSITVRMDASRHEAELNSKMENGYFLDGHIVLEATDSDQPNLSIPFLGFKGNFKKLALVEESIYDLVGKGRLPFYHGQKFAGTNLDRNFTHFESRLDGKVSILGQMPNFDINNPKFTKRAISPNNDGKMDNFELVFTLLRNSVHTHAKVYKSSNGVKGALLTNAWDSGSRVSLAKNHNAYAEDNMAYNDDYFGQPGYFTFPKSTLDKYPDGEYIYEMSGKAASSDEYVNYQQVFYIDTIAPSGRNAKITNNSFTFDAFDVTTDVIVEEVSVNGTVIPKVNGAYKLPVGTTMDQITIKLIDSAYNQVIVKASDLPQAPVVSDLKTMDLAMKRVSARQTQLILESIDKSLLANIEVIVKINGKEVAIKSYSNGVISLNSPLVPRDKVEVIAKYPGYNDLTIRSVVR